MRTNSFLILGANGLIGKPLESKLEELKLGRHRIFALTKDKLNITDETRLKAIIEYIKPTVIFNCAAISDPEICEEAKSGAFNVNGKSVYSLASICHKNKIKLIHFSTAAIFGGHISSPILETTKAKPKSIYGQSKFSGEEHIRNMFDDHLIIRPGWLFDVSGHNPVSCWLDLASRGKDIPIVKEIYGSPTFVGDMISATLLLLVADCKGTFNICNSGVASMQLFAETVLNISGLIANISEVSKESQLWWKAPMPHYSVLNTDKYTRVSGGKLRSWQEALKYCLSQKGRRDQSRG